MISGNSEPEIISEVFSNGAEDFLQKPINEEILFKRVEKNLNLKQSKERGEVLQSLLKKEIEIEEENAKKLEEIAKIKKKVEENIETPMAMVIDTISDMTKHEYSPEKNRLSLLMIIKTLGSKDLYKPAFLQLQNAEMEEDVKKWLSSQFTQDYVRSNQTLLSPRVKKIEKEKETFDFSKIKNRNDLSSFEFDTLDNTEKELKEFVMLCFKKEDFFNKFQINPSKMWKLLNKIESCYKLNHYHCFYHAVDTFQYVYALVSDDGVSKLLTPFDKLTILLASLFHDIDHPGVNNIYLINDHDDLAFIYNDQSVLEMHHCSYAFNILNDEEFNILESFSPEKYLEFRKNFISIIMSTDMAQHFTLVSKFKSYHSTHPLSIDNIEDRMELMKILMKSSDISNITRPFKIARKWARKCIEEFLSQGDSEKVKKLPVGVLNDRSTLNFPKSQIGFVDFVAGAIFIELETVFPQFNFIVKRMQDNKAKWNLLANSQKLDLNETIDPDLLLENSQQKAEEKPKESQEKQKEIQEKPKEDNEKKIHQNMSDQKSEKKIEKGILSSFYAILCVIILITSILIFKYR